MPDIMKKPFAISPILKKMTRDLGLEKEMALHQLRQDWPGLVGETIAAHTFPEKMKFKTLTLLVDSPAWIHELTFLKSGLIKKINRKLGKDTLDTLLLKRGPIPSPEQPRTKEIQKARGGRQKKEAAFISKELSSIPDSHLKAVIQRAMERHLESDKNITKSDGVSDSEY